MTKSHTTPHRKTQGGKDFRKRVQRNNAKPMTSSPQATTPARIGDASAPASIILKAGREKSLQRRHPWIFSGAIDCINGAPDSGDTLAVRDTSSHGRRSTPIRKLAPEYGHGRKMKKSMLSFSVSVLLMPYLRATH